MGLFGKIFDKKFCDICGGEIGLLGNRKLEDGNCCKNCAGKLSPWFDERRNSTIEEIKQQLEYREANKDAVAEFHMTRSFGNGYKILMLDEKARKFCVGEKKALENGNPDIVEISAITSYEMKTNEHRTEIYAKDKEGKNVSYNPPRYKYSYDFRYEIQVDHPYINKMDFQLNSTSVEMRESTSGERISGVMGVLAGQQTRVGMMNPEYDRYITMADEIGQAIGVLRNGTTSVKTPEQILEEARLVQEAYNQMKAAADAQAAGAVTAGVQAAAAQTAAEEWTCEYCGCKSTGNFCTTCGAKRD